MTLTTAGLTEGGGCWMIIAFVLIGDLSPSGEATATEGLLSVGDLALARAALDFGTFCFGESQPSAGPARGDLLSSGVRTGANGGGIIIPCVGEAGADL